MKEDRKTLRDPKVSIGMMVRNEGKFISEALESLVAQTYKNIEVFISDNASDDGTSEICRHYADENENFFYDRLSSNIGAPGNFNRVVEWAAGDFFLLAAGHDRWSENFIAECVAELESNPDGVLSFGTNFWIDGSGEISEKKTGWIDTREMDPVARFFAVLWGNMHPIYGVIRTAAIQQVYKVPPGPGADLIQLERLAFLGDFIHARDAKFYRRAAREEEGFEARMARYKGDDRIIGKGVLSWFPLARLPISLMGVVWGSGEQKGMKILMSFAVVPLFFVRYLVGRNTRR